MKADNVLAVIEKLGEIIINSNTTISVLEYENKKLKEQVERVEQYIDYYENDVSNSK
jgi:hypothetical protein